ncbi:hypothetical protein DFH07DRAFT_971678 [Mycena maculata]|uniref:Uncharacterized protein n=1 Tax=Mycena maculata TaxID=230809 RepID=A0AAD7HL15_9AGAR|nr:hypothetical protein DFH07DRAFT_971678 [Mycena maculata]
MLLRKAQAAELDVRGNQRSKAVLCLARMPVIKKNVQSMLYRFREAQAAELGLGVRGGQRKRMASACKSLRDCERWRGELLREISRKVAKIQDGLSDYEIVVLGGANCRRNVVMLDDDGKEVVGTKGYKCVVLPFDSPSRSVPFPREDARYFGRAKELPGVREPFQSRKKDEEQTNKALIWR